MIEDIKKDLEKIPTEERDVKKQFLRSGNLRNKRSGENVKRAYWVNGQGGGLDCDEAVYLSTLSFFVPQNISELSFLSVVVVDIEGKSRTFDINNMSVSDVNFQRLANFITPSTTVFSKILISPNVTVKRVFIKAIGKRGGKKVKIPILEFQMKGFSLSKIKEIAASFSYVKTELAKLDNIVNSAVATVESAEEERLGVEEDNKDLITKKTEIEKLLIELNVKKEKLEESVSQTEENLLEVESAVDSLRKENNENENNKQRLVQESKTLNEDISDKRRELRALESDRNILSDDYKDYVKEGRGQARLYSVFILCALAAVVLCAYFLVSNALAYISNSPEGFEQTVSMIMQRSPFVIGVLTIAGAMAGFAKYLFDTVVNINKTRLDLTKLLILAKEVSFSANQDSVVDDEVVYRERVKLKLEMLKSHLVKDIGEDGLKNRIDEIEGQASAHKSRLTSTKQAQVSNNEADVLSAASDVSD